MLAADTVGIGLNFESNQVSVPKLCVEYRGVLDQSKEEVGDFSVNHR